MSKLLGGSPQLEFVKAKSLVVTSIQGLLFRTKSRVNKGLTSSDRFRVLWRPQASNGCIVRTRTLDADHVRYNIHRDAHMTLGHDPSWWEGASLGAGLLIASRLQCWLV